MIVLLGGTYTGYFAVGHDLLISFPCSQSDKLSKAKEWKIPVVTHVWLENTFSTWTKVPFTELSEGIKNFENDPDKIITKGIVSESLLIPQESQNVELLVNGTDSAEKENFSVSPQANQNLRDDSAPFVKTKRGRKPSQKTVNKRKSVENTGAVLVSNDEQTKGMPLQEILVEETIFEKEKDTKSAKNTNSKRKVESSLVDSNSEDIKKVVNLPSVSATGIRFSEEEQAAFLCMGGSLAKSLESSTHLIAAKISRTEKFLKAIPLGLFIVTPDWFYDSVAVGKFLDESTYMLKDSLMEEKFHFSLQESLSRAKNSQIFTSMTFYIMERTTPPFKILEDIIVCAGGKVSYKSVLII